MQVACPPSTPARRQQTQLIRFSNILTRVALTPSIWQGSQDPCVFAAFATAAQGKLLVCNLSAPLQGLYLLPCVPKCHVNPRGRWDRGNPDSALLAALFCVTEACPPCRSFLLWLTLFSFSRKELKANSIFLGKGQGVSAVT